MTTADHPTSLIGRAAELAHLRGLLAQARHGQGSSVVVIGDPGTGKTALMQEAAKQAGQVRILRCRGVEAELALPYGGLHALLQPLAGDLTPLSVEQRSALSAALSLEDGAPASPIAVAMATLTLLAAAAATDPLLVLLDDTQWLDPASLAALGFAARRLDHDPVVMVATTRPVDELPLPGAAEIRLSGVREAETQALAEQQLGRPLVRSAAAALHRATDGNPLAILELLRTAAGDVELLGSIVDEPLQASARLDRAFANRITALSPDARQAALVVAVALSDAADVIHRALRELGLGDAALHAAEAADVLVGRPGAVAFTHPLLRAATFHQASPPERRAAHAALATASDERGARAWHAAGACVEQDETVAAELDDAADTFEARGGHLAAARARERAARLTPNPQTRADRLFRAGRSARHAARSSWARELLDEAAALDPAPALRCRIEWQRVTQDVYSGASDGIIDRYVQLAQEVERIDLEFASEVWSALANEFVLDGRMDKALEAVAHFESLGHPGVSGKYALVMIAGVRLLGGVEPRQAAELLRAAAPEWVARPEMGAPLIVETLTYMGEAELAEQVAIANLRDTRERGHVQAEMTGETTEIYRRFFTGEWSAAVLSADRSRQLAIASGQIWQVCLIDASEALIQAARGDELARELVARTTEIAEANGYENVVPYLASALGMLELGLGNPAAAVPHLERARQWCADAGYREPALFPAPVDLIDAYIALGRVDDAGAALDELATVATSYDRQSTLASVDRLRGLLAGDGEFAEHFERSLRRYDALTAPFDHARAHLHFGMRLRRAGLRKRAREQLQAAQQAFARLGARGWLAQTDAELRVAGTVAAPATPAPVLDAPEVTLTPQETAVADLVTQGLTNKEVAAQLFLTPKTIEWHLRQIYRKLGIRSRVQLAAHLHRSPSSVGGPA